VPEKITIDKSGANTAAVRGIIADSGAPIELRQSKYLNNLVEQDHRAVKRRVRPMMGFKEFHSAARLIAGIETMHMIKKGQLRCSTGLVVSDADRFYSLATRKHSYKFRTAMADSRHRPPARSLGIKRGAREGY
jgi:putative transposase